MGNQVRCILVTQLLDISANQSFQLIFLKKKIIEITGCGAHYVGQLGLKSSMPMFQFDLLSPYHQSLLFASGFASLPRQSEPLGKEFTFVPVLP